MPNTPDKFLIEAEKILSDAIHYVYHADMDESARALLITHTKTNCAHNLKKMAEMLAMGHSNYCIRRDFIFNLWMLDHEAEVCDTDE